MVGVGAVGQGCAFALRLRGAAREIVLIDRAPERATGVATDMRYSLPLTPTVEVAPGDWSDPAGEPRPDASLPRRAPSRR